MAMTRFPALFLLLAALMPGVASAAVTVTATNAANTRLVNSRTTFTWPIGSSLGKNTNFCNLASVYGTTKLDATNANTLLSITVESSEITTTTNTYVHAEINSGGSSLPILQSASDPDGWSPYAGSATSITLQLSDLCSAAKAGTAGCDFANYDDGDPEPIAPLILRIGVTTGKNKFCTTSTSTSCAPNGTSTVDWQELDFEFPRCATMNFDAAYINNAAPPAARYSYGLTASPGDGRAKVNLTFFPETPTTGYPYKSVIFLFEESATVRSTPMNPGSVMVREMLGSPSISSTTIDGLINDKTYNVQVAFVNVGGFYTPPGPPYGLNGDTSANAPQVTPSAIGGLLSEDACFIASATAGHDSTIVNVLRHFRDRVLTRSALGIKFVQWYYGWSPPRAQWLEQHPAWKPVIRAMLWPITVIAAIAVWVKSGPTATILFFSVGTPILLALIAYAMQRSQGGGRRRRSKKKRAFIFFAIISAASVTDLRAQAAETTQPYIDELKQDHDIEQRSSNAPVNQDHIEELKAKHGITQESPGKETTEPYIEELTQSHGITRERADAEAKQPYIDSVLGKSGGSSPRRDGQPYIEALKNGKELQPKKLGLVRRAAGIVVSAGGNIDVQAGSAQANSFESIYRPTKKYNPTVDIFYEYHLFRDRIWGAFGPLWKVGIVHARGTGRIIRSGAETDVKFQLLGIPVSGGLSYRAIQPRFVVPFAQVAAVAIPFWETRDDDKPLRKGLAYNYSVTAGVGFSLDWIGRQNAWDRYDDYGILHTYIVVQHQLLRPLFGLGRVDFTSSTTMAGLNFEF